MTSILSSILLVFRNRNIMNERWPLNNPLFVRFTCFLYQTVHNYSRYLFYLFFCLPWLPLFFFPKPFILLDLVERLGKGPEYTWFVVTNLKRKTSLWPLYKWFNTLTWGSFFTSPVITWSLVRLRNVTTSLPDTRQRLLNVPSRPINTISLFLPTLCSP